AEQKQMPFPGLHVQNDDFLCGAGSCPDLEIFAELVSTDVENNTRRFLAGSSQVPLTSYRHAFKNLHACAHPGKVSVQITAHCIFLSKTAPGSRKVDTIRSCAPNRSNSAALNSQGSSCVAFSLSFNRHRKTA